MVSLVERGHLEQASVRLLRKLFAPLDASAAIDVRWRGAALDRLLDEAHAALVGAVAGRLRRLGWLVELEVTYSVFGERGSIDIVAFKPNDGALLVVEAKTDLPSVEATLRKLDEKVRLAPRVVGERFKWRARTVSRLIIMPESKTLRRRVERHNALFQRAVPARNVAVRRWVAAPTSELRGIWFLTDRDAGVGISVSRRRERLRRPSPGPNNRPAAG
jgi:hypothetical protein